MSHIAAALAKSKGKPAPPSPPGESPLAPSLIPTPKRPALALPPAAAKLAAAARPSLAVIGSIAGAIVLIVGAAWFFLGRRPVAPPAPLPVVAITVTPAVKPPAVSVPTAAPAAAQPPQPDSSQPAPTLAAQPQTPPPLAAAPTTAATVTDAPATPEAPRAEPTPELQNVVMRLAMTAAMSGDNQRIVVAKHVYLLGDTVAEGLVLHEVQRGVVVFRDEAGAFYRRRF